MRALLFLLLFAAVAMSIAGRCYAPGTRAVIFIPGVYTAYDADHPDDDFEAYKKEFIKRGYTPERLVTFGYAGGSFDEDGMWQRKPYGCAATDRASATNLAMLEDLLRQYRERYPGTHFTLVGHSLGGYLAYLEGVRDASRGADDMLHVTEVITLDAPLMGVDADKKIALDAIVCEKTYAAAAEIVADKLNPDLAAVRQAEVASMRAAGIRLATFGNTYDCLYSLNRCTGSDEFVDDGETQYLAGADLIKRYPISGRRPFQSHFAILMYPQAVFDAAEFVGPP
jgi:pimeloyl-ACP methyl ester carboxylesterase